MKTPGSRLPPAGGRGAGAAAAAGRGGKGGAASAGTPAAVALTPGEESEETLKLKRRVAQLTAQLQASQSARAQSDQQLFQLQQQVALEGGDDAEGGSSGISDRSSLATEIARFEEHKQSELKRLQRERRVLERQAKAVMKLPDRKEREEVEGLKSELVALKKEIMVKEARWKAAVERLKKQLTTSEARTEELETEVAYLERCRLNGWSATTTQRNRHGAAGPGKQQVTTTVAAGPKPGSARGQGGGGSSCGRRGGSGGASGGRGRSGGGGCGDAPGDGERRQSPRPPSTKDDDV